jgi:DNA primase
MLEEKIKAILDEHGVSYKPNSRSYILTCPRCHKRDKLYIRKNDGRFVCWVCRESSGFAGKVEWCLTELVNLDITALRKELYGPEHRSSVFLDIQLRDFFSEEDETPIFVPSDLSEMEPDPGFRELLDPVSSPGVQYLESRGLPLDLCLEYHIQYWPAQNAVVFPAVTRGKLVGWQTRVAGSTVRIDPETGFEYKVPKAMTAIGLKKDRMFMFGDRITGKHAVLCEGPIDALKAHQCGGNVAALGKAVSGYQLDLLKHSGIEKLYLALDPDAFIESGKILKEMAQYVDVYDMRPPKGYGDIGEMPLDEVEALMHNAPRLDATHLFLYLKDPYARH